MIQRIKTLVETLNAYKDAYYNEARPIVSDIIYDELEKELAELEKKTGFIMANSPTQNVGYIVKSALNKVQHNHPMLSLDKTKSVEDIVRFMDNRPTLAMLKLDGLTISLHYMDGKLISAETRGDGAIGEDVLHTVKTFKNVPLEIQFKDELIVDGEAIITYSAFNKINSSEDSIKYKNPRNLASGSVRQLDSSVAANRNLKFYAWKVVKGFSQKSFCNDLLELEHLGFDIVPFYYLDGDDSKEEVSDYILNLKKVLAYDLPIDGVVFGYDDVEYGKSLGSTGHHVRSQIAFKFQEDEEVSKLLEVEWSMGKTGTLCPVGIFEPVELAGTTVSRASLHNISIMKDLKIKVGEDVTVVKKNEIIPQIIKCDSSDFEVLIPEICPVCGGRTAVVKENSSEVLVCTNQSCKGKLLGRLTNFVSKQGMNIVGLSDSTLEKFIELGWLSKLSDVYDLPSKKIEIGRLDGFGAKSADKLIKSIEDSRNVELKNLICALSIPGIGKSQAKILADEFKTWSEFEAKFSGTYNFSNLDGFGETLNANIHDWAESMYYEDSVASLIQNLNVKEVADSSGDSLKGKIFVVTGSVEKFKNRDELKLKIESLGGKVSGSISSKTSFLINNDTESKSSKNKKAADLGIPVISETQFLELIGES